MHPNAKEIKNSKGLMEEDRIDFVEFMLTYPCKYNNKYAEYLDFVASGKDYSHTEFQKICVDDFLIQVDYIMFKCKVTIFDVSPILKSEIEHTIIKLKKKYIVHLIPKRCEVIRIENEKEYCKQRNIPYVPICENYSLKIKRKCENS